MENKKILLLILILCLLLRIVWIFVFSPIELTDDPKAYDSIAKGLVQGEGYHEEGKRAFRPPGYPYFLAALYSIFGAHPLPVKLVQAVLGVFTCLIIFLLGKRFANERTGLWAAGFFAVYPQFIRYPGGLYAETLFIVLLFLAILILFVFTEKPTYSRSILAGILMGFAALTREVAFLMLFPIAFWMFFFIKNSVIRKTYLIKLSTFFIFFILTICPWTLRNYFVFHEFVLFSTSGGFNFYIGNNPEATGEYDSDLDTKIKWPMSIKDKSQEELLALEIEASKSGYKQGMNFIINNPTKFLKLSLKKLFLFWRPPYYNLKFPKNIKETPFRIAWLINYSILMLLAIPGIVMSIKMFGSKSYLFHFLLLSVTGLHMLVYTATRYRLPLIPILMIFAALTIDTAWTHIRQ